MTRDQGTQRVPWLGWGIAIIFSACLFVQYPWATTFPVGGDAARTIHSAQLVQESLATSLTLGLDTLQRVSDYPASVLVVAASSLWPLTWPERWIWLTVAAHFATALTLGAVIRPLIGWRAAAFATAAWGVVGMAFTWHVVDATLAQLLSLPALLATLAAWWRKRWWRGLGLWLLTYALHPLSALVLVGTALWFVLITQPWPRRLTRSMIPAVLATLAAGTITILFLDTIFSVAASYEASEEGMSIHDLLANPIGPLVLLAPLGWVAVAQRRHPSAPWWLAFALLSTFLYWHFRIVEASAFLVRWQTYFALAIAALGALGLDYLLHRLLPHARFMAAVISILLFVGLGLQTWQQNTTIFRFFESPSRYERVHLTEQAAYAWLDTHLPAGSVIVSTKTNRHTEWLPILTRHQWVGLPESDPFFSATGDELRQYLASQPYTHLIFLTKREKPTETMPESIHFKQIYTNPGVVIIDLATYAPPQS